LFDLGLSDEQEQLEKAYQALCARECDPEAVRAAEDHAGFSPELWARIGELGGLDMALPESVGGAGALFLDVVVVQEVLGAYLAPVPLAEAVATTRLLATLHTPAALDLLAEVLEAGDPVTLTPRPAYDGQLRFVPAGAVADVVVAQDGERIVAVRGDTPTPYARNLGSLPVADRALSGTVTELASGPEAVASFGDAVLEWRGLTAAQLVGAGQRTVEIGVTYTTQRHAFGVPIASFQTIAHRLADAATALDGAQLAVRKAGWAVDARADRWRALLQIGFVAADQAAEKAVDEVLHFHGGYGFMLEYDIQLYFRRIKAWALQNGDRAKELERIADLLWGPVGSRPAA
jgi:alkylation response protein AidB-like acyl-CoA dehydrogenase